MRVSNEQKWAIGLIEAEGNVGFNRNSKEKKTWVFTLKVGMMKTNARAIYKLKTIMGVGKVHKEDKNGMVVYKLSDRQKIKERLYPLLEAYPFRGEKYYEYEVLKEGMKVCEDETLTMDQKDSIMEKLKEKSNIVKELTPVVCEREEDRIKSIKEVIENLSVEKLKEIYDPWWIAGFVEGEGSFQINGRLQNVFELGQMHDKCAVYALHKIWQIPGLIRINKNSGYEMLSTKHPRVLEDIIKMMSGKMLGMKSFELKVWEYAYNTKMPEKKLKAKILLEKLRSRAEK